MSARRAVAAGVPVRTPAWDRTGCREQVCTCHDETAAPYACSGCGCRPGRYVSPVHPSWAVVMIGRNVYVRRAMLAGGVAQQERGGMWEPRVLRLPRARGRRTWLPDLSDFMLLRPVSR